MHDLAKFKKWFDPKFAAFLQSKIDLLPESLLPLGERIISLGSGGKRLRPFMAKAGNESGGGKDDTFLLPLFYSLETYHLFALIHDDIMDRALTRHGVPCVHVDFGLSQAILAGDLCLSWAYASLSTYSDNADINKLFGQLSEETILGQMMDVSIANGKNISQAMLDMRDEYKTTRYSFLYPALIGLNLSQSIIDITPFKKVCYSFGYSYQRLDDLADIFWTSDKLGKEPFADIRNNTPTRLTSVINERGTARERDAIALLGSPFPISNTDISLSLSILKSSPAFAEEIISIRKSLSSAQETLKNLQSANIVVKNWYTILNILTSKLDTL